MFASSGISILIQFVFFFLLARIYSPAVYGLYGIFNVYVSTLGNSATLGYNQAFVIPREERDFSALLRLTLGIAFFFSLAVFLITLLAGKTIIGYFKHDELGNWVYLIAPTTFLIALDRISGDWAIRNKEFKGQTLWSTTTTLASKIFNALYGWLVSASVAGLVFTTLLQHFLRVFTYAAFILTDFSKQLKEKFSWQEIKQIAKEYKEFPLYIYWGNVINILSNNLPAALLTPLGFAIDNVGYYSYSLIVLDLPIRLLGAGVASVFMQKAAELAHNRMHELADHTWRLYKVIVYISLFFSFVVFVFGEKLYLLMLEERWVTAGRAAEVLIIFYYFRMISAPLSSLFNILRKEKQYFAFQVLLVILRVGALVIGAMFTTDFIHLMFIYSMVNAIAHFGFCIWIFRLIKFSALKVFAFTLITSASVFGIGYLIKCWMNG
jgi:O-antigen/teichoic acid export membrane protein